MRKLTILFIISLLCSFSISAQTEKKSAYKKFVERFDKATTKVEEEAPEKIEKGMETFTDNLEDFENDIHAEPKKQSKFAQIFNYFVSVNSPCVHKVLTPNIIRKISFYFLRVSPQYRIKFSV